MELAIEREQDIPALIYEGRSRAVGFSRFFNDSLTKPCFFRRPAFFIPVFHLHVAGMM